MKVGEIYTDQFGNRVKVICGDYMGLNRGIVYGQFIDRVAKPCTAKQFENACKQNRFIPCTFAIWDFNFKEYTHIKADIFKKQMFNREMKSIKRLMSKFNSEIDKTKLPNVLLYSKYLNIASLRFNLSMDECRNRYGLFTIEQWESLLQN